MNIPDSNGEMICDNCSHYRTESPHGNRTWPNDFYLVGRAVIGYCQRHEADLFVNDPCAAWLPLKEKQHGN